VAPVLDGHPPVDAVLSADGVYLVILAVLTCLGRPIGPCGESLVGAASRREMPGRTEANSYGILEMVILASGNQNF